MTIKGQRHKGSFVARDDGGREYRVHIYQDVIDAGTDDDPNGELEGLKDLRLEDGRHVNRSAKGSYEIVVGSVKLLSTDPLAP